MIRLPAPSALAHRAELYDQWATLLTSGVPMLRALAVLRRSAFVPRYRRMLGRLRARLEDGESLPDALVPERNLIPPFELALIRTGDRTGRLDVCLKELSEQCRLRAKWMQQGVNASAYPVLLLAFCLVLFPVGLITAIVTEGDWMPFLVHKAQVIGVISFGALAVTLLLTVVPLAHWIRALWERVVSGVPVLGRALHERALARLVLALDAQLNAGIGVVDAWPAAGEASGSIRLRDEVGSWRERLEDGQLVSQALEASRLFPDLFTESYRVGEISGKLEDTLRRLRRHYEESSAHRMEQLAIWTPRLLYFATLLYVAMSVLGGWQRHWAQFDSFLR